VGLLFGKDCASFEASCRGILAGPSDALSPRMVRVLEDLAGDWRRLDERIEGSSKEIEAIAYQVSSIRGTLIQLMKQ
jgi:transposase